MYIIEKIIGFKRHWLSITNEWITDRDEAWKYTDKGDARRDAAAYGGWVIPA